MNEKGTKRREWVKTAAIIFLVIMLILTFFSNTIMNYSLPEVATQYVQSGTITAKIRGSGTVTSSDPYNVEVKESRKVSSVAVRVGDEVQQGDVLYYLEDTESDELKAAQEALAAAKDAYNKAMLSTDLTSSDIQAANNGVSIDSYRQQITDRQNAITSAENAITAAENAVTAAENEVKSAQKNVDNIQAQYDAFDVQIDRTNTYNEGAENEIKAYNSAKTDLDNAKYARQNAEINGADEAELARLQTEIDRQQLIFSQAEQNLSNRKSGIISNLRAQQSSVNEELKKAKEVLSQKQALVAERQAAVTQRQEALADRKQELEELNASISRVSGLLSYQEDIDKAQQKVDELTAKTIGSTITAPIAGTVTSLNVTAGNSTSAAVPVAVLQPEGKGYTLSFSVTNAQAAKLSVGDVADLNNAWRYGDATVTLSSIKVDTNDPGQKKVLTFDVVGSSITAGQSLSVSVGQKSSNYDLIVPNSAIREDNNGKFILIVESKSSPLGTRYYASRVDVEVLASDDTQSAISAALYGYEFVITTSTKPVEAGKLVRLAD